MGNGTDNSIGTWSLRQNGKGGDGCDMSNPELELVGAVDIKATQGQLTLPDGSKKVPLSSDLSSLLEICHPKVLAGFHHC